MLSFPKLETSQFLNDEFRLKQKGSCSFKEISDSSDSWGEKTKQLNWKPVNYEDIWNKKPWFYFIALLEI